MDKRSTRELTRREKQAVQRLVTQCANYDCHEKECLLLETGCPMLAIVFTTSALCSYFREAVLPMEPATEAIFTGLPLKECLLCKKKFPTKGRKSYCSVLCADKASRMLTAKRVQKHRKKRKEM